jgi:hypothetical protein
MVSQQKGGRDDRLSLRQQCQAGLMLEPGLRYEYSWELGSQFIRLSSDVFSYAAPIVPFVE